jgi:hypothetical protein
LSTTELPDTALSEIAAWEWFVQSYPAIARHLQPFTEAARRRTDQGEFWWELRPCAYYDAFEKPKIMYPDISAQGNFFLDSDKNFYCGNTVYFISSDSPYLVGILNSKLITYFYTASSAQIRGGYLRFFQQYVEQIPIVPPNRTRGFSPLPDTDTPINFDDPADKARHDRMVKLVEQMLSLKQQYAALSELSDKRPELKERIDYTDRQIDALVYELYRLTDDEIRIVEGA